MNASFSSIRLASLARWVPMAALVASLLACPPASAQDSENIRGTVRSLTTAPKGEIDGAVLDNGTVLHWPPHLEDNFKAIAGVGERVEGVGRTETAPRGEVHFELERLTNLRTGAVAINDDRGPPRKERGRSGPEIGDATTVRGVVRSMTTAPKGEIDGAVLDNGTMLHWPPHLQGTFTGVVRVGDRVEADGRTETAPRGEVKFEVERVTNLATSATAENDDQPRVPGRGKRAGRDERIQQLQEQLSRIQRELDDLRREP